MAVGKTTRIRSHLCSWVMLSPTSTPPYTPLPNEQTLLTSSPRIAFSLSIPSHYPGKQQQPFSLSASSGLLYLTNRRIIFLPDKSTPQLQSFAAPILNLHDSHVTAPWFGPNVWTALLQPTQGGGIPTPSTGVVEVKFTFKEGGAFDFHTQYERVRERLQQALEVQRIDGDGSGSSSAAMNRVDVSNVDLEDLPVYQEEGDGPLIPPIAPAVQPSGSSRQRQRTADVPDEAPPGYEEAQMAGLQDELDRRLQNGQR
jgi:WW domain-binding protein 2